jgi:hypothetical protein
VKVKFKVKTQCKKNLGTLHIMTERHTVKGKPYDTRAYDPSSKTIPEIGTISQESFCNRLFPQ